jgi:hypothetical protein
MPAPQTRGRRYKAAFTLTRQPAGAGPQLFFMLADTSLYM